MLSNAPLIVYASCTRNININRGYSKQGRSQDFSKGGGWSYGSKSLEKEKLLVIRIVKENT